MLKFCRLKLLFRFAHQRGNTFQSLVMYPAGVRAKRENKEREEGWWQRGNGWFLLQSYESTDHEKCEMCLYNGRARLCSTEARRPQSVSCPYVEGHPVLSRCRVLPLPLKLRYITSCPERIETINFAFSLVVVQLISALPCPAKS